MDKTKLTRGGAGPTGLPQDDVEIPGVGSIRVRAMNRGELLMAGKIGDDGKNQRAMEMYVLSSCVLDPEMTQDDVADWMASAPAMEIQPVVQKINELSGVSQGAAKSDVHGDGDRPVS